MKKNLSIILALTSLLAITPGCAAANTWWQQFQSNPVAQVQTFEQGVQIALSSASVAWGVVLPLLPLASQAKAQADYNNAVVSVNHGLQALNDAVQAAVDAKTSNPDFSAAIAQIQAAVTQVLDIVNQYTALAPPSVSALSHPVPGIVEAKAAVQSLTRFSGKF